MELLVRAARNDHLVISDLCAPAATGLRLARHLPVNAVVADANVAASRPQLRERVEAAGVPFLVDPATFLLQDEQAADQAWARLPFAIPSRVRPSDLADPHEQDRLVDEVLRFQREHGATVLIPPYVYLARRDDGWLPVQLALLDRTARYLEREGIDLPVAPIFAASLRQFGPQSSWAVGLDAFLARVARLDVRFVGVSFSWSGQGRESYDQLATLLTATRHAAAASRTVAWRQGLYGAALVAAGADGYETGAGHSERGMYASMMRSRRPRPPADDDQQGGYGGAFVYLAPFGRSVRRTDAEVLLHDPRTQGSLVCADESCCPSGASSMTNAWRQHAVRSRAAQLAALAQMPDQATWRLNQVARDAERSHVLARTANDVLAQRGRTVRMPEQSFAHLAAVADAVRAGNASHVA